MNGLKKNKNVIKSIWDDTNSDNFVVGFIHLSDEDYTLIESITVDGILNGLYLTQTNNIFRVSENDRYTNSIAKLFARNGESFSELKTNDLVAFDVFFEYAKANGYLIAVKLENEDTITGKVISYDDESLVMELYDEYGYDGESEISIVSIICARCNSHYEKNISKLNYKE